MYEDKGYRFKDLKIEYKHLFCRGIDTGWYISPHESNPKMWWIIFEDGTKSSDFYNIARAKENMGLLYLQEMNSAIENKIVTEAPAEPRGCV